MRAQHLRGARPGARARDCRGGPSGSGRAPARRFVGPGPQPERADVRRGCRRRARGRRCPLRRGDSADRPDPALGGASPHGRRGRRAADSDPRRDRGRLRRPLPRGGSRDRRPPCDPGLPLRGFRRLRGASQPGGGPQGGVRGIRRKDEGPAVGPRFRTGESPPDGRSRRRRGAGAPDRLQHQPGHEGPARGRRTSAAGSASSRRWASSSPTAARSRSPST